MIRVGIGGWTYEPWRALFFPEKLPKTQELSHASRRVTSIEVNGTFYSTFTPSTFRRWAGETPDDFIFALKAPRFAVNRRVLAEAVPSIDKFFGSGVGELRSKLGPILWQLAPTKKYDSEDIAAFLALLPKSIDGLKLRHVIEVRHESFRCEDFITQVRKANIAVVLADSEKYPVVADLSADFVYVRLQEAKAELETGYGAEALGKWAALARAWERGEAPEQFPLIAPKGKPLKSRDVFIYFINGAKERAPAAAEALIRGLGFRQFRVRHHDTLARLELPLHEISRLWENGLHEVIAKGLRELGYVYVTVDLQGFRSGSGNEALRWTGKK